MSKLTLLINYMETTMLGKDVTVIPECIARHFGMEAEVVSLKGKTFDSMPEHEGTLHFRFIGPRLKSIPSSIGKIFILKYLLHHSKEISILMCFSYNLENAIRATLYKRLNPNGLVYIKCDINSSDDIDKKYDERKGARGKLRKYFYHLGISSTDVISVETETALKKMAKSNSSLLQFKEGQLVLCPNGFDVQSFNKSGVVHKEYCKKENIILTVGRLGTYPKNTEMLLKAAETLDFKGWKLFLTGPATDNLLQELDSFRKRFPEKSDFIVYTGPVYDKSSLWEIYNRSKVFVLTSRYESSGLVLIEAQFFGCYLLSTDVGQASQLILREHGHSYGELIDQESPEKLSKSLQRIINGETSIDVYDGFNFSSLSAEQALRPVIDALTKAMSN